ncbi:hypothetical protein BT93_C1173 [Corymbia citriodora subsp. variegata]|nr:hypothetical protein BT93_C1173 [Corymbia citriodora subsp. variegata]
MNERNALYGLAAVLPLAPLSVYAYRFLQERRSANSQNYDVFLSFRGLDTRTGFADFLYNSLVAAGIRVFRDDDALPVGEEVGTELLRAIRTCRIAIPIISEQYMKSTWCLRELTEIIDSCRTELIDSCRTLGHSLFPVFYNVEVAAVRGGVDKLKEALGERATQFSSHQVEYWAYALRRVGTIKGWISQNIANGYAYMCAFAKLLSVPNLNPKPCALGWE